MKTLIGLVGLPLSGKSTYAKYLGFPIVSPDAIRIELTGNKYNTRNDKVIWATVDLMIRSLFEAGHDQVILDAANINRRHRFRWIKSNIWIIQWHLLDVNPDLCIERAGKISDSRYNIIGMINKAVQEFEDVSHEEGKLVIPVKDEEYLGEELLNAAFSQPQ